MVGFTNSPCGHNMLLTDEQIAIIDHCSNVGVHKGPLIKTTAKAGSGKTTSVGALACEATRQDRKVLAISFSKNGLAAIVRELVESHGISMHRQSESHYTSSFIVARTVDSLLAWALGKLRVPEASYARADMNWQVTKLRELGGTALYDQGEQRNLWSTYNYDMCLRELCDLRDRGKALSDEADEVVASFFARLADAARKEQKILPSDYDQVVIDHATEIAELIDRHFDLLVLDEDQDSSFRDLAPLVELGGLASIQVVLFGDSAQSVMGFRGALGDIVGYLRTAGIAVTELALTYNFRSTCELVHAANTWQVAAKWRGPLARPGPKAACGPRPIVVQVSSEDLGMEVLFESLFAFGAAPADHARATRIGSQVAGALGDVGRQLAGLVGARSPLIEVIHRTRDAGNLLQGAFDARNLEYTRLKAAPNPYDTYVCMLISDWFIDHGDVAQRLRSLLVAHANKVISGARSHEREEIRACSTDVIGALRVGSGHLSRDGASKAVLDAVRSAKAHPAVGQVGQAYLSSAEQFVTGYRQCLAQGSVDAALAPLINGLRMLAPATGRKKTTSTHPTFLCSVIEQICQQGVAPESVPQWLSHQTASWRKQTTADPGSGILMKTGHGAKGDTCDAAVIWSAEKFPLAPRASKLAGSVYNALEEHAEGYVPITRSRYGLVLISVDCLPKWHDPPLDGWDYLAI